MKNDEALAVDEGRLADGDDGVYRRHDPRIAQPRWVGKLGSDGGAAVYPLGAR